MNFLKSLIPQNANQENSNIQTAYNLQYIGIPTEFLTILVSYAIFNDLKVWVIMAISLLVLRSCIYIFATPSNLLHFFVLSNLLSIIIWMSFGIICSQLNYSEILVAGLILTGLVSGTLLFLTYVKYLFIFYSALTLGVFGLILILQGGILTTIGGGLIVLVIFLSSLSQQYYNLSNMYFKLSRTNSLLYDKEQKQVNELSTLRDMLNINIRNRQHIENKIVQSNDLIHKSIQKSIVDDDLLQQEIMLIYQKADYGILLSEEDSSTLISNPFFSVLWGINSNINFTKEKLRHLIKNSISTDNSLFINLFPFCKNQYTSQRAFKIIKNDGKVIDAQLTLFKKQESVQNLWIFKDATDQYTNVTSISRLGQYDSLTELPARRLIYVKLTDLIKQYQLKDLNFAVAFIDINDFKLINDSLGHSMGNEILKIFAKRLSENIRPIDFAGRLGGDEFICIFNELTYKSDVEPLIKHLKNALEAPITLNNNTLMINASIGTSFYPCDTESIDELISFADIAMYQAKENTRTLYERFLPEYTQSINELHKLGQELKAALFNNEFYLVFQPIYETTNHQIAKVEVLLSWRDHAPPNVFIPIAERLGLIHDIGLWVLSEACKARYELSQIAGVSEEIKFCINISSQQLQTPKQVQELLTVVEQSSCNPAWLEFELTESTLVDLDKAIAFINSLKSTGIGVAIDDFGTGFSSLSYLKNLYFDVIKIDKNFLTNIFDQPREMNIFQAIINLAQKLEAKITVEGVETKAEYDFCVDANCHFIQGFYMAKPLDFTVLSQKFLT